MMPMPKSLKWFVVTVCCIVASPLVLADDGDVIFWNTNETSLVAQLANSVQYKIIIHAYNGPPVYTAVIRPGDNDTLPVSKMGISKGSFDVYIANINVGTGFKKCLTDVAYDKTSKPMTIAGFTNGGINKDVDYGCTLTGSPQ